MQTHSFNSSKQTQCGNYENLLPQKLRETNARKPKFLCKLFSRKIFFKSESKFLVFKHCGSTDAQFSYIRSIILPNVSLEHSTSRSCTLEQNGISDAIGTQFEPHFLTSFIVNLRLVRWDYQEKEI